MPRVDFDPRNSRCVECGAPFKQPRRSQGGGSTQLYCSGRCRANSWARGNTGKRKISVRKYEAKPESKKQKRERARRYTLNKYAITEEQFSSQLERQNFRCYGCLGEIDRTTARIDHDHKQTSPSFRGLLCDRCNHALGHAKDSREILYRLATYLRYDRLRYSVYIVGSLRNPRVTEVAREIRAIGCHAFDDWISAGPEADDYFQKYQTQLGATYAEALKSAPAEHIFNFDLPHLDHADAGVLVMPAGKSGHLELGYLSGRGKRTYILLDKDPERFDIMPQFANGGIFYEIPKLVEALKLEKELAK